MKQYLIPHRVVEKRGWVADDDNNAVLEAGYSGAQILEVFIGISFTTLSNYTNNIADTQLDDTFASKAWALVANRLTS